NGNLRSARSHLLSVDHTRDDRVNIRQILHRALSRPRVPTPATPHGLERHLELLAGIDPGIGRYRNQNGRRLLDDADKHCLRKRGKGLRQGPQTLDGPLRLAYDRDTATAG